MPADILGERLQHALADEYSVVRLLGQGGMGAVYLARELALQRLVAVKVLPPVLFSDSERRDRFQREAQLAAHLSHPNIVPLHRFGQKGELSYYVMGFVRGESLAARLRRDRRMPAEESRGILAQLADALEYAHGKGVIHRDIKPDNILLDDESGRPMLADFGIAQRAGDTARDGAGRIEGTLHYMSPEQAAGNPSPDRRDDIYSLGVVGYVMLSGETPFAAEGFLEFAKLQATVDPIPLASRASEAPSDLATAVTRALERDPAGRWPDARAFKDALGVALENDPDRLPGELREVAGSVFYCIAGGWIAANLAAAVVPAAAARVAATLAVLTPVLAFVATALIHRRKGFTWAELGRVAAWPPGWWPFWWPQSFRRPWDLWSRLPPDVRRFRAAYSVVALAVMLAAPLALRASTRPVALVALTAAYLVVTALMLLTAWWAHRNGIPNNADLRSLIMRSTADHRFWKRPQMLKRLLPAEPTRRPAPASTPAQCVQQMTETMPRLSGLAMDTGVEALTVARAACSAITDLGDAFASASAEEREAIASRRELLTRDLETLCRHQLSLADNQTDEALRSVSSQAAFIAASLSAGVRAHAAGDSPTFGATGTSLGVTRAGD